jgi:hypothetical protein
MFLTSTGEVYTLCPVILGKMVFSKETFDLMMTKLEDSAPKLHQAFDLSKVVRNIAKQVSVDLTKLEDPSLKHVISKYKEPLL